MKWPNWHPDQSLTAEDFLAWEDFLLAQGRIARLAPGLERIDLTQSVHSVGDDVEVRNVAGITHSGMPIEISTEEGLKVSPVSGKIADAQLAIQVAYLPHDTPKLSLRILDSLSQCDQHSLYLGKWRRTEIGTWSLVDWPLVRRVEILKDHSRFNQLAEPVTKFLYAAMSESRGETAAVAFARMSIRKLSYMWTTMDLNEIRSQLLAINWAIRDEQSTEAQPDSLVLERQQILSRRAPHPHEMTGLLDSLLVDVPKLERTVGRLQQGVHFSFLARGNQIELVWLRKNFELQQIVIAHESFSSLNLGQGNILNKDRADHSQPDEWTFAIDDERHLFAMISTTVNFSKPPTGNLDETICVKGVF